MLTQARAMPGLGGRRRNFSEWTGDRCEAGTEMDGTGRDGTGLPGYK